MSHIGKHRLNRAHAFAVSTPSLLAVDVALHRFGGGVRAGLAPPLVLLAVHRDDLGGGFVQSLGPMQELGVGAAALFAGVAG